MELAADAEHCQDTEEITLCSVRFAVSTLFCVIISVVSRSNLRLYDSLGRCRVMLALALAGWMVVLMSCC